MGGLVPELFSFLFLFFFFLEKLLFSLRFAGGRDCPRTSPYRSVTSKGIYTLFN